MIYVYIILKHVNAQRAVKYDNFFWKFNLNEFLLNYARGTKPNKRRESTGRRRKFIMICRFVKHRESVTAASAADDSPREEQNDNTRGRTVVFTRPFTKYASVHVAVRVL